MAVSILNQWPATWGAIDAELAMNPTPGNTLVAVIGYRVIDGSAPMLSLGDVPRNAWKLLSDNIKFASSTHPTAQLQVEVWACPSARYDGWPWLLAYASAMQMTVLDVGSALINVIEVPALPGELTVDSVTLAAATNTNSVSVTVPAPAGGADCLMVAGAIADIAYGSYTTTGTGWAQLQNVINSNPNVGLMHAWREATTGGTCTFSLAAGFNQSWTAVAVAIRTTGTTIAQPNPAWPSTRFQVGLGYDMSVPLSRVRWTDQTKRYQVLDASRGIQAERGVAQQGQANVTLLNYDGAYTPRDAATAATATAAGTTTTIKVATSAAGDIHVADFFRLLTSGGTFKELNVFQVVSRADAGGTTTVTFTRADGSGGGAQAATASGDVYAGIPIDLYIPWRLVEYVAGTPYIVGSGRLADLQIDFTDAHRSIATGIGVDELETLATVANPSALRGEIYRHGGLVSYWPLDDASGAGYAANQGGVSNAPLTQTTSKYGAGSATADFGAATQNVTTVTGHATSFLGDQGSGWQQDGLTSGDMNAQKGYSLVASDPSFPPLSGGVTIVGAMMVTNAQLSVVGNSTTNPTVCILRNGDPAAGVGQGSIIKLSYDRSSLLPIITVWDKDTHASSSTTVGSSQVAGDWHVWTLVFDRTSWAVYVNGNLKGSGTADLVNTWTGIEIGGEASQFYNGKAGPATHAHIAVYDRKLTAGEVAAIATLGLFGRPLDPSTAAAVLDPGPGRAIRKLNTVGWKGTRVINPDGGNYAAEDAPSGSIFDVVSEVLGYQDGLTFLDAANQLQGRTPGRAYHQTPRAILGDGPGELPYQPGQSYGYLRTALYNDVEVGNTSGVLANLDTTTLVAVDDTSAGRYGSRTLPVTTRWTSNAPAWHLGWWLLGRYAYPRMRVQTITVSAKASNDTASSSGRWAFVCGVEVGDLVTINRRPLQPGQPMISLRCLVLQVSLSFKYSDTEVSADVTLTLAAAPPQVAVCGPTTGSLAGTVLGL